MEGIRFRKAVGADAGMAWRIICQAKERMRLAGSLQWQDDYPALGDIASDIECGYGYVLVSRETVVAYGAVVFDGEPAYEAIDGSWINEPPYVALHRLAVANEMTRKGLGAFFMREVEALSRRNGVYSFRVDTNFDNLNMQKILALSGFSYCGEIRYDGAPRMAFEKSL